MHYFYLFRRMINSGEKFNMLKTPKGLRLQIGIFGKRNAGKSSLLNALVKQDVVIVSNMPGTTTDPIEKAMELPPIGPVLFIDTAGLDEDNTELGQKRKERSSAMIERCDLLLIVSDGNWNYIEDNLLSQAKTFNIPVCVVFTKADLGNTPSAQIINYLKSNNIQFVSVSSQTGDGIEHCLDAIIKLAPEEYFLSISMLEDIVPAHSTVVLVVPIDKEAPKGRLILPQVQAIRDLLDHNSTAVVTGIAQLNSILGNLKSPPDLVITDSQAFAQVSQIIPQNLPFTSFSILLARMKGDIGIIAKGAATLDHLHDGSVVLVAEACTHHAIKDDIAKIKLPNLIQKKSGKHIQFEYVSGPDFPNDLSKYDLVLHCGSCTFNRREVLARIAKCEQQHVPFSNFGVALAHLNGILERALKPFPNAYLEFKSARTKNMLK